jgi:hypothetical protein
MAAARTRDIAFIVLLAGLGQTGDEVVQTQTGLLMRCVRRDRTRIPWPTR